MHDKTIHFDERRRDERESPIGVIRVTRAVSVLAIEGARVLNVSPIGAALVVGEPVQVGERLSFYTHQDHPPILAEVIACEKRDANDYFIRCKCLLGGFDA